MEITVEVTLWVDGIHFWKGAPPWISFLKHPHRHRMQIIAGVDVTRPDREVEFYSLQIEIKDALDALYGKDAYMSAYLFGERSCETIAQEILDEVGTRLDYVSVSEDGENRAIVTRSD